ncbi:short chain dehydrogenase family protein [Paraburkholderia xenovorans LB400]|uniref:Short-chain dehydrogenase/reductase n=1 Tax=Paraburkholderia xenovorans (strain LB400) TaxID=266265 RepID=Q13GU3_PARXL|nr:SDR family oxidoreductase [Paraburkholderia xenovorans]ABE36696.1 Putative short-chain dehydrogenase/reductase [Paraburkholderia xenovorans LB400]AIP34025.1 short chain dehydrogenase family protein [Paraburkholderia xenovorans LB400]
MPNGNTTSSLHGKFALVTGGARGLGLEIAQQLATLGAHVIIGARDTAKAEAVATELRNLGHAVSALKLDVTSDEDRQAAYAEIDRAHGRLDILINNAGILLDSPDGGTPATRQPSEALPNVVRDTFEANFFAPVFLTQTLLPLIRRSSAGRIVNVSSIRGSLAHLSDPCSPVYPIRALGYDTSKAALNAFTILIAAELRDTPIKINAVHPGWLRTSMGGERANMSAEDGAHAVVKYASLGEDGPTGGFFFLDERLPW